MTADCAFRIGYGHAICQDYGIARSGETARVILADGCSSSPDTDLGARLLVRTAERLMATDRRADVERRETGPSPPHPETELPVEGAGFHRRVVRAAAEIASQLGLNRQCLDATLLTLASGPERWTATLYGDGVLAVGDRNGRVRVTIVSYPAGYPDYPSYLADPDRRRLFEALAGNERRVDTWSLVSGEEKPEVACPDSAYPNSGGLVISGVVAETAWIAVLTDGVHSFSRTCSGGAATERIPLPEVLAELLAFRSWSGVFVQRRLQRFLKECEARSWRHADDLSMGALAFEERE